MTNDQYYSCVSESLNYSDKDAYISDMALSSIWGDDSEMPRERIAELASIYDATHRTVKDIATAAGVSVRQLAIRFGIPQRTIENWAAGVSEPPMYVMLMMQECAGILKIERTLKKGRTKKMTIKEVMKMYKGKYADVEIYKPASFGSRPTTFHSDEIKNVIDDVDDDTEVINYDLADEYDYNNSVLANTCERVDFGDLYGDKNAKVLLICVDLRQYDEDECDSDDEDDEIEEPFDHIIREYYQSCLRTGHYDMEENARWFCEENCLDEFSYTRVLTMLSELERAERI